MFVVYGNYPTYPIITKTNAYGSAISWARCYTMGSGYGATVWFEKDDGDGVPCYITHGEREVNYSY